MLKRTIFVFLSTLPLNMCLPCMHKGIFITKIYALNLWSSPTKMHLLKHSQIWWRIYSHISSCLLCKEYNYCYDDNTHGWNTLMFKDYGDWCCARFMYFQLFNRGQCWINAPTEDKVINVMVMCNENQGKPWQRVLICVEMSETWMKFVRCF